MQKKNKLNKTGIAVFIVAFCLVFFVLQGREVFSYSSEAPWTNPALLERFRLEQLPPDIFLELARPSFNTLSARDQHHWYCFLNQYIFISRLNLGHFDPEVIKASWHPEDAERIGKLIISSKKWLEENSARLRAFREAEIDNFVLADDFPEDKIEVFNNFIRYSAPSPIIDARLGLNGEVSYEDFLSAVSFVFHMCEHYSSLRAVFFVEKILEPLHHDLRTKEFRGYRFPHDDLPASFRRHAINFQRAMERGLRGVEAPHSAEMCMSWHYEQTFESIREGRLLEAYNAILKCRIGLRRPPGSGRIILRRPYYFHTDEERYQWFRFLQAELRHFGHYAFADQIMEVELDHYRELIVWQLQKRAYLAQRLYEIRDSITLSTLKNLLMQELTDLRNNNYLEFEEALDTLRAIDDKVRSEFQLSAAQGVIILPWIDRRALDRRIGRGVGTFSRHFMGYTFLVPSMEPIERIEPGELISEERRLARLMAWRIENENMDEQAKKDMREVFDWILFYIRVLAVASERLYVESSLEKLTQLHSILVNNRNVSFTEIDQHVHHRRLDVEEINEQTRLDIRRFYVIVNDFWNHQFRRQNGDMTVGDVILPWVKVRDEWF